MPLLPYIDLLFYGPDSFSAVEQIEVTTDVSMKSTSRMTGTTLVSVVDTAHMTTLIGQPFTMQITVSEEASMKQRSRVTAIADVAATPSAYDIAQAVWGQVASSVNVPGSTGAKLNDAGGSGDPWNTDLSAYNTQGTAGKVLKDKLTKNQFLGLK